MISEARFVCGFSRVSNVGIGPRAPKEANVKIITTERTPSKNKLQKPIMYFLKLVFVLVVFSFFGFLSFLAKNFLSILKLFICFFYFNSYICNTIQHLYSFYITVLSHGMFYR